MTRTPEPPDFSASQLFLRRLAFSLVHDEARADDLVQDTWTAWAEHRPSNLAEPRAWLARVLRNRAFNEKRSVERRSQRESLHGRPDPSSPETDGTLEALRKLDEPYRSTLVQRYYHDLAPKEIAERSGAPPFAGMGGGLSLLGWLGLTAALTVGVVFKSGWLRSREGERQPANERQASAPEREPASEHGRVPVPSEESDRARSSPPSARPAAKLAAPVEAPPISLPTGGVPSGSADSESFHWPQYAGGADHANFRERRDEIHAPRVLWFLPGCAGQPTLRGEDLYTGGLTLARLDPETGVPTGVSLELLAEALEPALSRLGLSEQELAGGDRAAMLLEALQDLDPNDAASHTVAAAPVVTPELVLARRTRDGGVSAYDRELENLVWSWDCDEDAEEPSRVPLCLASDEVVVLATRFHLIALRVVDGKQLWRFFCDGEIRMAPASDGKRVFVGTDRGIFYCLALEGGAVLWSRSSPGGFGASAPVVVGERVLVADVGARFAFGQHDELETAALGPQAGRLLAFAVGNGGQQWAVPISGYRVSDLGLGPRQSYLVVGQGAEIGRFDLGSGKRDEAHHVETEPLSFGSPTVVGDSLVFGDMDGLLCVHELDSGKLRWSFRALPGSQGGVSAFVHVGARVYVATSIGLFCLGDDPARRDLPELRKKLGLEGFQLRWSGNPREPSFLSEEK
jgi:outer membrane protein assembly factor BamB